MHGARPSPDPDHRFDHDSWTHGLMSAALGRPGAAAEAAMDLRTAVDAAVSAIPRRLTRSAREAARARRPALRASFQGRLGPFTATFRAERERIWVDATIDGHHVTISVEPMGRSGRTGVVQGINASASVARDVLATLQRGWDAFLPDAPRQPSVKGESRERSTLAGSTASMHPR